MTFHCGYHLLASNCQVGLSSHSSVTLSSLTLPVQTSLLSSPGRLRLRARWIYAQTDLYHCCCGWMFDSLHFVLILCQMFDFKHKRKTSLQVRSKRCVFALLSEQLLIAAGQHPSISSKSWDDEQTQFNWWRTSNACSEKSRSRFLFWLRWFFLQTEVHTLFWLQDF